MAQSIVATVGVLRGDLELEEKKAFLPTAGDTPGEQGDLIIKRGERGIAGILSLRQTRV